VKLTYAELSAVGPVRRRNEDFVRFWQSDDEQEHQARGALALVADGVGGHASGDVASRLAVETALRSFLEADPTAVPRDLLLRMFDDANRAVHDEGSRCGGVDRMATTMTVSLFRGHEVVVGHVGDSRTYLVSEHEIRQLTTDHTYVAMQVAMSLISKEEAKTSELRNVLTRSVGHNDTVEADLVRADLHPRDVVIQCTDGLHGYVADEELRDAVLRMTPGESCEHLVRLAERRGSHDNISVQVVRIESVPRAGSQRGSVASLASARSSRVDTTAE